MKLYKVRVKDSVKQNYSFSEYDGNIGFVIRKDFEHIYFNFIRRDNSGFSFITSTYRFLWDDIVIKIVYETFTDLDVVKPEWGSF